MKFTSCFEVTIAVLVVLLVVRADIYSKENPSRGTNEDVFRPVAGGHDAEPERVRLVGGLIRQRTKLVRAGKTRELLACDQEIKHHPAPAGGDAGTLARLLVGKWRSPRHDSLYRADGSWTLLPAEPGTLHGHWQISGNQLVKTSGYTSSESLDRYTLILLTDKDYAITDGENVFCESRVSP